MSKKTKGKVFVGMSGGVDSSVSAALLQKEGYDVTGVFMKVWQPDFLPCTWEAERRDALRVAAHLGIPLLTWDFEKEYKENVADYMIREYRVGRTPNPDVMCNREIKFGAFFRRAIASGGDFVATGHYAEVKQVKTPKGTTYKMFVGMDESKDQSYFLWTLGQRELSKTFFPIGGFKKSQVRMLAKKFRLPVAEKKDSQGLCFMGKLDMKEFLAHFIEEKEGSVIDEQGVVMGSHRGAFFYTLGERHGFSVDKKTTNEKPYYIVAKDLETNTLIVAHQTKKPAGCATEELCVSQGSFVGGAVPDTAHVYTAQVRYHGEFYASKIRALNGGDFFLQFEKPVLADAGQSVVIYDGKECVGGGVIESKLSLNMQ